MARTLRILGTASLLLVLIALPAMSESAKDDKNLIEELKLFSRAIGVINEAYVADIQPRKLLYQAVKGMLASLDKHCEFIDPERYSLLKIFMRGEYAGIGAILQIVEHYPFIRAIQPGSAAEKAHLEIGDKILKVNGVSMENKGIPDVAGLMRGEAGSSIRLTLWRQSIQKNLEIEIKREKIEIESVRDATMATKSVGYIRIVNFEENTVEQVDKALKELAKKGMKDLIIDLRNNDGGLMQQAVELAERFLPKGKKILSVKSKIKEQEKEYLSSGKKTLPEYRLVVLVNHQSASASEIFSGAMQDHKRGIIVGTQTYGKGSVQSVIPLDDASAMRLTTARYLTPLGRMIDGVGITPDEAVEDVLTEQGGVAGGVAAPLLKALTLLVDKPQKQ